MNGVSRRTALQSLGGAGLAAVAGAAAVRGGGIAHAFGSEPSFQLSASGSARDPLFTFVSMPDFFNGDVGDLRVLSSWDGGLNSVNDSWTAAIDKCLGAVSAEQPDAVFLPGDLVEGRWNMDPGNRQLFGPVSQGIDSESIAMCESAISVAGGVYYPYHANLFTARGLRMYPAVGDHELLDDRPGPLNSRWTPSGFLRKGAPDNRYYLVDHCKSVWADHFTLPGGLPRFARRPVNTKSEFTAYSVSFADALTLITVDVFTRQNAGVRLGVFGGQLSWLRNEIRRAKRRGHTVVVQGHIPILAPSRWLASGRLRVPEGRESSLYKVLDREGVDLYLCGEVHDSTMRQLGRRGPVQISHGCIFQYGFSYLVGRLYPDQRLELDLYEVPLLQASIDHSMWTSDVGKSQRTLLDYGEPVHRGRLVQRHRVVSTRTEKLSHYRPNADIYGLRGHLGTVLV
ncbi:MAG: metallophosphoesterase [Nocardioides sp.]